MAEDRAVEEPVDQIARLQRELDDFKTTLTSRLGRRPTGDIEESIRATPKQDTLICNGQTLNRADYPALWQFAQDQGSLGGGRAFGTGNGTTTFTIPDLRGVIFRGMAVGETIGQVVGADSLALSAANLPGHAHDFTTSGAGNHGHSFSTDGAGSHGGHFPGDITYAAPQDLQLGVAPWNSSGNFDGYHSHTGGTDSVSDHTHYGTTVSTGTGTEMDNRQASFAGNYLIWV